MAGFGALARTPAAFAVAVALVGEGQGLGHLAIALATGIGVPRIYRGAHYPLDVAAGALFGRVAGIAARLLVFRPDSDGAA